MVAPSGGADKNLNMGAQEEIPRMSNGKLFCTAREAASNHGRAFERSGNWSLPGRKSGERECHRMQWSGSGTGAERSVAVSGAVNRPLRLQSAQTYKNDCFHKLT